MEQEDIEAMGSFLKEVPCSVCEASSDLIFDIQITLYHGEDRASVRITDFHTNLVHVSRNGEILLAKEITGKEESALADKSTLTIENIFALQGSGPGRCPGSTGTSGSLQHGDRRGRALW